MLKHRIAWLSIAAATALMPRPAASGEDAAKQAARFSGEWVVASVESDGVSTEARLPETSKLTIRGEHIEFVIATLAAGREEKGTYSVVGAGPDHLKVDVHVVERSGSDLGKQPDREFVRKELWRMTDAGKFQRCMPLEPSGGRPGAFSTKKGDGLGIITFERREK